MFLYSFDTVYLVYFSVNLDLKDCLGKTAWDYCEQKELHYCRMILRSHQTIQEYRQQKQMKKVTGSNHKVQSVCIINNSDLYKRQLKTFEGVM